MNKWIIFSNCLSQGKLLYLHEPQFPHHEMWGGVILSISWSVVMIKRYNVYEISWLGCSNHLQMLPFLISVSLQLLRLSLTWKYLPHFTVSKGFSERFESLSVSLSLPLSLSVMHILFSIRKERINTPRFLLPGHPHKEQQQDFNSIPDSSYEIL